MNIFRNVIGGGGHSTGEIDPVETVGIIINIDNSFFGSRFGAIIIQARDYM